MNTSGKRELSQLNAQNLKMLSQRSRTPTSTGNHHEEPLKKAAKSLFPGDEAPPSKSVTRGPEQKEENANLATNPDQLRKQSTFISALNDSSGSKLSRSKSRHASYYDALLPKYKQLSKFANDDYGTYNLVKVIEQQVMYGDGIKTLRLINGTIEEVTEENYSQLLFREMEAPELNLSEGRRNIAKHKEEEYKILKSRLKTKGDLRKLIDDTPYPRSMSVIKAFSSVCIVMLTALLIAEYLYTRYRLQDILDATDMLSYTFQLKELLLDQWYNSRELFLIAAGNYTAYAVTYSNTTAYIEQLRTTMDTQGFTSHLLVNAISSYPSSVSSADVNAMQASWTPMYLYSSVDQSAYTSKNYSIFQAAQIVCFLRGLDRVGGRSLREDREDQLDVGVQQQRILAEHGRGLAVFFCPGVDRQTGGSVLQSAGLALDSFRWHRLHDTVHVGV